MLEDENKFRTLTTLGLSSASLPLPPNLAFGYFQGLEAQVRQPDVFMDAAIEYIEYLRDANDLVALARLGKANGAPVTAIADYADRALESVRGADASLQRLVPLLRGGPRKLALQPLQGRCVHDSGLESHSQRTRHHRSPPRA